MMKSDPNVHEHPRATAPAHSYIPPVKPVSTPLAVALIAAVVVLTIMIMLAMCDRFFPAG